MRYFKHKTNTVQPRKTYNGCNDKSSGYNEDCLWKLLKVPTENQTHHSKYNNNGLWHKFCSALAIIVLKKKWTSNLWPSKEETPS